MENYPTISRQSLLLLSLLIGIATVFCAALIFLTIAGYGTVRFSELNNDVIHINGHQINTKTIKIRPGSYKIIISSPTITPYQGTLSVGLFKTTVYSPKLESRSPTAIVSSILGGTEQSGALQFSFAQWFNNRDWLAGLVGPGGVGLVLQYDSSQARWLVEYYEQPGYQSDLTKLPVNIATYVEQLEAQHNEG